MFEKFLAKAGVGGASIELEVLTKSLTPGSPFEVLVRVKGGKVAQEINTINLQLMTTSEFEDYNDNEILEDTAVQVWSIDFNHIIQPLEENETIYELLLHPEAPITAGLEGVVNHTRVWIDTTLDIEDGLDASDRDYLNIYATVTQAAFLNTMIELGFSFHNIDVKLGNIEHPDLDSDLNCYQSFEFKSLNQSGIGLTEIEVNFVSNEYVTGVILELDKVYIRDMFLYMTLDNNIESESDILPMLVDLISTL